MKEYLPEDGGEIWDQNGGATGEWNNGTNGGNNGNNGNTGGSSWGSSGTAGIW